MGFGFDVYPTEFGIKLGPISIGFERNPEPYNDDLPDWGFTFSTYPRIYRERGALYLLSVGRFNPVDDPEGER